MTGFLPEHRQTKPIWQKTAQMFMDAHASGRPIDLQHATAQLRRAIDAEGWTD
jgi:hypothetical protein